MNDDRRFTHDPDGVFLRDKLEQLIRNFDAEPGAGDLRRKVLSLVDVVHGLRTLGRSLIPKDLASSARDRILHYFCMYPLTVIAGDELLVVSGIQEYARRVRELRVQFGWKIVSGATIGEMATEGGEALPSNLTAMAPSEYVLLDGVQDREAAHRWNMANAIRKKNLSVRDKILELLLQNVGRPVTGEELRYVAGDKTEWACRVRELRTEFGWPIATKATARPDLAVGDYVLEAARQCPEHDRSIPDDVRSMVLRQGGYKCAECGWSHAEWNKSDPRHLELHHVTPHVRGGGNTETNLKTLCTVCHDAVHRRT